MATKLISVVGGRIVTLGPMLDHYISLGVDEVALYVNVQAPGDPLLEEAIRVAKARNVKATPILGEWPVVQDRIVTQLANADRQTWHLIADEDEFQHYPDGLRETLSEVSSYGCHYLQGCFVDRFAVSGRWETVNPSVDLALQFPLGSFFTWPVTGGRPIKVVAARGGVILTNGGHHKAASGNACPIERKFIQVNHFKWTGGLLEYLRRRSGGMDGRSALSREDARLIQYYVSAGERVDLAHPGLLISACAPEYANWDVVKAFCAMLELRGSVAAAHRALGPRC